MPLAFRHCRVPDSHAGRKRRSVDPECVRAMNENVRTESEDTYTLNGEDDGRDLKNSASVRAHKAPDYEG